MVEDVEKETGPILAIKNDARITRELVKYLEKQDQTSYHSFYVLKGNMSIVGSRPERIEILY